MRNDDARGFSLTELLATVAVMALVAGTAAVVAGPLLAREGMRSDLLALQSSVQRARMEAVSRNRPCHIMINARDRRVRVVDGMGTASLADDVILFSPSLSSRSAFDSPDGSAPLSITKTIGEWYRIDFATDGSVSSGTGRITLRGGDAFGRLSVYAAGGTQAAFWDGSAWYETGS